METAIGVVIGIGLGVLAVVVVLVVLGRRLTGPRTDPTQLTFDPAVMAEVQAILAQGRRADAIHLLRERTPGLSLVTATMLVERLDNAETRKRSAAAGRAEVAPEQAVAPEAEPVIRFSADESPSSSPVPLEVELEARGLKAAGHSEAAVDLVQRSSAMKGKEAREYVAGL